MYMKMAAAYSDCSDCPFCTVYVFNLIHIETMHWYGCFEAKTEGKAYFWLGIAVPSGHKAFDLSHKTQTLLGHAFNHPLLGQPLHLALAPM